MLLGDVLYESGGKLRHVYFPTTSIISLQYTLENGSSANAVPRDIEKGLEAGFSRYLTKPIKVTEFMDALDVALHFAAENGLVSKEIVD